MEETRHTKKKFFSSLILKQEREFRVDFPSFSSDFRPTCLFSAITLTLSFLWLCVYFSPIQTLQYMSSPFCSAPCCDPCLWNVSLILVLHI